MAELQEIRFILNERPVTVCVEPARSLLNVLREDLDITGTKQACDCEGECGACTVLLDGEAVRSCLTPIGKVDGRRVITVEGLATDDTLHPLQRAFIEYGAVQCGYCTPGMIMTSAALLLHEHHPSREQIIEALDGNICRCTGYTKIIEAVEAAAAWMRGEIPPAPGAPYSTERGRLDNHFIGGSQQRVDAKEKVTGAARYAEDIKMPGMLHAAITRSPHPHARILSIETAPALAVPGVLRVLTASDIPGQNSLEDYSRDEHFLAYPGEKVRMIGDPLAIVIAETLEAARAGAEAVAAEYELLPHTYDAVEALRPGAPLLHAEGNILNGFTIQHGELDAALGQSDVTLETHFQTAFLEHCAMEREAILGYMDDQDVVTIVAGNQEPHWAQGWVASVLALPVEKVRVITPPTGGAFGGRQDPWPIIAGGLAAWIMRRPVRITYTRYEVFTSTPKRHPYTMDYRLGAKSDGTLTGLRLRVVANTGAYDSAGYYIPQYALVAGCGPYRWQAVDAHADSVYSNGPKAGQMRGFGTPQSCFALECTLDELTERLEIDPLELRLRNAVNAQTDLYLGHRPAETIGYQECLETMRPHYQLALAHAQERNAAHPDSDWRRGVGLAGMWYRFGKSGRTFCEADAELDLDGGVTIYFSAPEYGQGIATIMAQLAADALQLPRERIRLVNADTALTPDSGIQGASRSTYWVGGAVQAAAMLLKERIFSTAAEMLDCAPESLHLEGNVICPSAGTEISWSEVAGELERMGQGRRARGTFLPRPELPEKRPEYLPFFISGVQIAEVAVNRFSGDVRVERFVAVHDIGRAINPQNVQGQIEGSIVMGMGAALMEECLPGKSTGYTDYYLPTACSIPKIEVILVEKTSKWGPHGAKGLGEAAILASTPAIINGIARATGARLRQLPATPERVRAALAKR